jgi:hypothetical protein
VTTEGPSAQVDADAAEIRGVRRIFLVALAVALLAAGVALAVELTHHRGAGAQSAAAPLPFSFSQPGFVDHPLRRVQATGVAASGRRSFLQVAPSSPALYVIARCDTGRVTVTTDTLTSAQPCTGKPVGVVALAEVRRPTRLVVTVNLPQRVGWAVGIYR